MRWVYAVASSSWVAFTLWPRVCVCPCIQEREWVRVRVKVCVRVCEWWWWCSIGPWPDWIEPGGWWVPCMKSSLFTSIQRPLPGTITSRNSRASQFHPFELFNRIMTLFSKRKEVTQYQAKIDDDGLMTDYRKIEEADNRRLVPQGQCELYFHL